MNKLDKFIEALAEAHEESQKTKAVKLSTLHKQFTTTKTEAEENLQAINRINRNAPVKIISPK